MKIALDLTPVEETLLIPLWARAEEAHAPEPLLIDPRAVGIRDQLAYDFTALSTARASQVGCCVRARLVDTWVRAFLEQHPDGTVLELGCGLDGRYERVDNGRVRWFDVDLPDVIDLRRQFFDDSARRTMLAASVLTETWIETVRAAGDGPWLIVTEGMLPYFDAEDVRDLLTRLADAFAGASLVFDAMTPLVIRHQRHHDAMRHFRARFTWSVRRVRDLEAWDPRIRIEESQRFHDLLAPHGKRLPRLIRLLGTCAGAVYPPFKRSYTVNRARLG